MESSRRRKMQLLSGKHDLQFIGLDVPQFGLLGVLSLLSLPVASCELASCELASSGLSFRLR